MNLSPSEKRGIYILLFYYVVAIAAVIYFVKSGNFKTGQCNPGLDLISIFLYLVISSILLIISIYKTIKNRRNKYLLLINVVAVTSLLLFLST
jgi:hypothetical protein